MAYLITNQNNFANISYKCPSFPKATVASGGCGPCSVLNCVENTTTLRFKMQDWINYVIKNGGRIDGGTSITAILKALKRDCGFDYECTNDLNKVKNHLKKGGYIVFHGGYGNVFSSAGHYVCLAGIKDDGRAIVIDSAWYKEKYSSAYRKARVTEGNQNGLLYVSFTYVEADKKFKKNEGTNYYLITIPAKKEEPVKEEPTKNEEETEMRYKTFNDVPEMYRKAVQRRIDKGLLKGDGNGNINVYESAAWQWTIDDRSRYATIEDVPTWGKDTAEKLANKGLLVGDGKGNLDLHEETLRQYVVNDRAGLYD